MNLKIFQKNITDRINVGLDLSFVTKNQFRTEKRERATGNYESQFFEKN